MQRYHRVWIRPVAMLLVFALLASTAHVATAQSQDSLSGSRGAAAAGMWPEGAGVTPLTIEELQAADGEMVQALIVGARLAAQCIRSAACRRGLSRLARGTIRVVRRGLEAAGAWYTAKQLKEDLGR